MAQKEEILSLNDIKDKLKLLKKDNEKISFLKKFLINPNYTNLKKDLISLMVPPLLARKSVEYKLTYDSFSEGLEPIYFWILDFMRDKAPGGLGMTIKKGIEGYEASIGSGYFGEIGARATQMQQKAAEYLGAINTVIKSILNLVYDLNEFEIRLKNYDHYKSKNEQEKVTAMYALKGIWMDNVDVRAGRGSVNSLTQELNFATLRDAFFIYGTPAEVNKADLNDRVKRILVQKLGLFNDWRERSELEIRNRFTVEKAYLKSQVGTLKLYSSWVKPYLVAAQKLKMKEFNTPDIVSSFSNLEMSLTLYGSKEVKPESVKASFKKIKTDRKYYSVVKADLHFRTIPTAVEGRGGRHYVHGGRIEMVFTSYMMDDIELNAIESQELYEDLDLVEKWVNVSLETLAKDVERYINENVSGEKKEEKKSITKKPVLDNPFKGALSGFGEILYPFMSIIKPVPKTSFLEKETLNAAQSQADKLCYLIYYVYKKAHGMIDMPD